MAVDEPDSNAGKFCRPHRAGDRPTGMTPEQLARTFVRGQVKRVSDLLETLVSLGQARALDDGRYVRA
jgi:hypothetical protein